MRKNLTAHWHRISKSHHNGQNVQTREDVVASYLASFTAQEIEMLFSTDS